ncbi:MAG: 5-bromo-4-chloroindolyl phosphate hydrolysis family protein [Oscillospiraceae bacterium]|nr:5-bromo-4-chloroindolyl phosphate hydrolysis family protein [Oscillospiraceae bacterium]
MKTKQKKKKNSAWLPIGVALSAVVYLIPIWPLALFALFRRLSTRRPTRPFKFMLIACGILLLLWGSADFLWNAITLQLSTFAAVREVLAVAVRTFVGLAMFLAYFLTLRQERRFERYEVIIGVNQHYSILNIAKTTGRPVGRVTRDLDNMIVQGRFGEVAFLDAETCHFVRSGHALTLLKRDIDERTAVRRAEQEMENADEFQKIILEIGQIRNRIRDVDISKQVEEIEAITAQIFKSVRDKPEKMPQIRGFLNYYLPTTLKLMRSYCELEQKAVAGENITAAKANIQEVLGRLVTGFTHQSDALYKEDALDIESDIQVLEQMLKKDGFLRDGMMQ